MGYVFAFLFGCLAGALLRRHVEELEHPARRASTLVEDSEWRETLTDWAGSLDEILPTKVATQDGFEMRIRARHAALVGLLFEHGARGEEIRRLEGQLKNIRERGFEWIRKDVAE